MTLSDRTMVTIRLLWSKETIMIGYAEWILHKQNQYPSCVKHRSQVNAALLKDD